MPDLFKNVNGTYVKRTDWKEIWKNISGTWTKIASANNAYLWGLYKIGLTHYYVLLNPDNGAPIATYSIVMNTALGMIQPYNTQVSPYDGSLYFTCNGTQLVKLTASGTFTTLANFSPYYMYYFEIDFNNKIVYLHDGVGYLCKYSLEPFNLIIRVAHNIQSGYNFCLNGDCSILYHYFSYTEEESGTTTGGKSYRTSDLSVRDFTERPIFMGTQIKPDNTYVDMYAISTFFYKRNIDAYYPVLAQVNLPANFFAPNNLVHANLSHASVATYNTNFDYLPMLRTDRRQFSVFEYSQDLIYAPRELKIHSSASNISLKYLGAYADDNALFIAYIADGVTRFKKVDLSSGNIVVDTTLPAESTDSRTYMFISSNRKKPKIA